MKPLGEPAPMPTPGDVSALRKDMSKIREALEAIREALEAIENRLVYLAATVDRLEVESR